MRSQNKIGCPVAQVHCFLEKESVPLTFSLRANDLRHSFANLSFGLIIRMFITLFKESYFCGWDSLLGVGRGAYY